MAIRHQSRRTCRCAPGWSSTWTPLLLPEPERGAATVGGDRQSDDAVLELVARLHATPQLAVLEVAGAGTRAIAWLHEVGGSSRTVLEATDRYSRSSLADLLGAQSESVVGFDIAMRMAMLARQRARRLAGESAAVVGVGCTAAIASDRPKRGAHRAVVAIADGLGVSAARLQLQKGARDRREEERQVSRLVLEELARACGLHVAGPTATVAVAAADTDSIERRFTPAAALGEVASGSAEWLEVDITGDPRPAPGRFPAHGLALLSGSFNPLHDGHRALADAAASQLGREAVFELPMVNADKSAIDPTETRRRAAQFAGWARLLVSRAPLFGDKAQLYPGAAFVIGADTAVRLVDTRFYGGSAQQMDAVLDGIAAQGASFVVAGRSVGGHYLTLGDIALPARHRTLFAELPERDFRDDISSSAIRERRTVSG